MTILDFIDIHGETIGILLTTFLFILGFLIERKTKKIQTALVWKEFREPIVTFSKEAIFTLSEAAALCDADHQKIGPNEFWKRYSENLTKLTSHIDQGRLVIPNLFLENNSAYGGIRDKAIECLVAAYQICKVIDWEKSAYNRAPVMDIENIQYKTIRKWLSRLPDQKSICKREKDDTFKGWSCKTALVEVKRQYVEEVSKLVQARQWAQDIKNLARRNQ